MVVCEVERRRGSHWDELLDRIRRSVIADHDLPPDAIVLVRHNSVPKTSSGKVQRHTCRQEFIDGTLKEVARWSAWEETEKPQAAEALNGHPKLESIDHCDERIVQVVIDRVRQIARERAGELNESTNIVTDLGLDSLERMEIARELEFAFGGRFPDEVLQEVETIGEVASAIETHFVTNGSVPRPLPGRRLQRPEDGSGGKWHRTESYYQLEKMPEFVRLQRSAEMIEDTGLRNPFFSVHDGRIADTTHIDGRELISFASYNYLGLSGDPEVNQAAKDAIDLFGTSVSASRVVSGEKTIHRQLEFELSDFLGVGDVVTFPGGATNQSVIGHLVGSGDLIVHDSLAHNSIIEGAKLSGARRRPFDHNDFHQLDQILGQIRGEYRRDLIAIEGLYSMDGDYPELPRFVEVKEKHKAWLYVDERIRLERRARRAVDWPRCTCSPRIRGLLDGDLSKSLGSCGGFIAGSKNLIHYLKYTTPGFVFAAGLPPADACAWGHCVCCVANQNGSNSYRTILTCFCSWRSRPAWIPE